MSTLLECQLAILTYLFTLETGESSKQPDDILYFVFRLLEWRSGTPYFYVSRHVYNCKQAVLMSFPNQWQRLLSAFRVLPITNLLISALYSFPSFCCTFFSGFHCLFACLLIIFCFPYFISLS